MPTPAFHKWLPLDSLSRFFSCIIEYETPKVVTVHNPSIGLLRRGLQLGVVLYVTVYQLWYAQGYQEFAGIESSVTTKVKGYSQSSLGDVQVPPHLRAMYERVWDEADYVVPPAENGAFFVTTNVVITPNQTWGECPEDPGELPQSKCVVEDEETETSSTCTRSVKLVKSHGPQTGRCVLNDKTERFGNITVCQIQSWCPVEDDRLVLGRSRPLITGSENHTAFIKNSIRFSHFGDHFHRNNMPPRVCIHNFTDPASSLCNIFRLGDIVLAAGGNYTSLSVSGGVVAIHIKWICNLDFDFTTNCLPQYHFRLLDSVGWNFRHAHFHEEGRRTLYKAYGIKFVIIVQGRAGKFDLKNTVINIVAGLGLLSFITMFCDFILLNYVSERKIVKQKKFEVIDRHQVLTDLLSIMTVTNSRLTESKSSDPETGDFQAEQKMRPAKKLFQKKEKHKSDLDSVVLKENRENGGVQVNGGTAVTLRIKSGRISEDTAYRPHMTAYSDETAYRPPVGLQETAYRPHMSDDMAYRPPVGLQETAYRPHMENELCFMDRELLSSPEYLVT